MEHLIEYLGAAWIAWFMGFFPLAEIYVAIPTAFAAGLDPLSVLFWTVFGNYTPIVLIHFGYESLRKIERVRGWLDNLVSESFKARIDRYGIWFVLLATPWIGVWAMSVGAKVLRMNSLQFLTATFASVFMYAVVIVSAIHLGFQNF